MLDKSASRALEVQGSVVGHAQRAYFSSCGGGTRVVPGAVASYINEDIQSDPEVGDMAEEIPIVDIEDIPIVNIENIQSEPEVEEMEFNGNPFEFNSSLTKARFKIMAET